MFAGKKVLVLDDEPIVCERLKSSLEKYGLSVETFTDSQKALERLAEECFDVLVTDLKMKQPDGLEVVRFVKENCPRTKVVVITGFATEHTASEVLEAGASEFIAKPFKISTLRELVLKLLAEKGGASGQTV